MSGCEYALRYRGTTDLCGLNKVGLKVQSSTSLAARSFRVCSTCETRNDDKTMQYTHYVVLRHIESESESEGVSE